MAVKLGSGHGKWHETTAGATEIKIVFHLDDHCSVRPHISAEKVLLSSQLVYGRMDTHTGLCPSGRGRNLKKNRNALFRRTDVHICTVNVITIFHYGNVGIQNRTQSYKLKSKHSLLQVVKHSLQRCDSVSQRQDLKPMPMTKPAFIQNNSLTCQAKTSKEHVLFLSTILMIKVVCWS